MFFLYFLSLFYLQQLVFSQVPSESEEINKIISDILLRAEKKNANTEYPEFPWNIVFTDTGQSVTKHYRPRSSKKPRLDFNLFAKAEFQRANPTLKLYDILPELNRLHGQRTKNGGNAAQHMKYRLEENQSWKDKNNKYTKTMFAGDPISHLPQTTVHRKNNINYMNQEQITDDHTLSFNKMTVPNTMPTMNAFRFDGKSSNSPNEGVTKMDWLTLEDAEAVVNSVPTYERTTKSIEDLIKRMTGEKIIDLPSAEKNFEVSKLIENSTLEKRYEIPSVNAEDLKDLQSSARVGAFEEYKVSTGMFYPTTSSDLYLLIEPKNNLLKAVFDVENIPSKNVESSSEYSKTYDMSKIGNYMSQTLIPSTILSELGGNNHKQDNHDSKTIAPTTKQTLGTIEVVTNTEYFSKDEINDKKLTTNFKEKSFADSKSNKADKDSGKKNKLINKKYGTLGKEISKAYKKDYTNRKISTIANLYTDKVNKENNVADKKSNTISNKSDIEKIVTKETELNKEIILMPEASDIVAKESDFTYKVSDKPLPKENEQINNDSVLTGKKMEVLRKESNSLNIKNYKDNKQSNVIGKEDETIANHYGIINKEKDTSKIKISNKINETDKKTDLADLYEDIIKNMKKTTKVPQAPLHDKIAKHFTWESIKRLFGHDRVCSCKCRANRTMCRVCAASDAVIRELTFEFNNLADFMNAHCTEIQTFFWMNPIGGKKLRDTVHRIDRTMQDYYKRVKGKCSGRTCETFGTYLDKKRSVIKKKRDKKFLLELLRDLELSDM